MDTRRTAGMDVSAVGMGCMAFSHGYGRIPDEACSIEAIRMALDLGRTFFDTAEVYSPSLERLGHNERIVGKALKGRRNQAVLAAKLFAADGGLPATAASAGPCAGIPRPPWSALAQTVPASTTCTA